MCDCPKLGPPEEGPGRLLVKAGAGFDQVCKVLIWFGLETPTRLTGDTPNRCKPSSCGEYGLAESWYF
jgi:hypothetical protein